MINLFFRHSRESGNPVFLETCDAQRRRLRRVLTWTPAFAGVMNFVAFYETTEY